MEPYVGEIRMFAGIFAPIGFLWCDGSLQSIAEYEALYSLIGTTWGGNGTTTFALPNLRSNIPIGQGAAPGLTPRVLGQYAGANTVTLADANLPQHNHAFNVCNVPATTGAMSNGVAFAAPTTNQPTGTVADYATPTTSPAPVAVALSPQSITIAGGGQPHENQMPTTSINYIIAWNGVYPTRP